MNRKELLDIVGTDINVFQYMASDDEVMSYELRMMENDMAKHVYISPKSSKQQIENAIKELKSAPYIPKSKIFLRMVDKRSEIFGE